MVNFTTAPGYKIAKSLVKIIRGHTNLENNQSVKSYKDFTKKVNHATIQPNYKLVSFDIVDLYTNVPIEETLTLLRHNLINNGSLEIQKIDQLMMILKIILNQNYFSFEDSYYKPVSYTHLTKN